MVKPELIRNGLELEKGKEKGKMILEDKSKPRDELPRFVWAKYNCWLLMGDCESSVPISV